MTRLRPIETSIISLAVLVTAATNSSVAASETAYFKLPVAALRVSPLLAQTGGVSAFPLPTTVPVGTKIRIGGSSSMETINQVLKRRFEQQFVGTMVELNTQGTGPAIKDLLDSNADLAAIGRALTEQEKAQGLVSVPVSRHKIAIIVGSENPFRGSLTFEQFAKIFRGEIKDWSQIGGVLGAIQFIDRPDNSDTRQAFRNYPVFKRLPFVTGTTAQQLAQDSTSQVVQALGKDGIGYAIADQLQGRGDVRVLSMHKTLPSSPKYPFSQPLIYVYKGPQPNPSAQAFLGYATAPASRQTIETARKEATAAIPPVPQPASPVPRVTVSSAPIESPSSPATPQAALPSPSGVGGATATNTTTQWGLWLLGLPLLGGAFWWLLKRRDASSEFDELDEGDALENGDSEDRLYGATGNSEADKGAMPDAAVLVAGQPSAFDDTVVRPVDDEVKRSDAARASGTLAGEEALVNDEWSSTTVAGDRNQFSASPDVSRIILVPRTAHDAYVYWELNQAEKDALKHQGGQQLVLRVYEPMGTGSATASSVQQFSCNEWDQDQHVPIPVSNLDYVAELGYTTLDGRFLRLARSPYARIPGA